jgi:hypothetical protein
MWNWQDAKIAIEYLFGLTAAVVAAVAVVVAAGSCAVSSYLPLRNQPFAMGETLAGSLWLITIRRL